MKAAGYGGAMPVTLEDLYASPDHYLHSFEGEMALFVPMDRAHYHRSIFLDRRISRAPGAELRMPAAELGAAPRPAAPTSWIFHVAHCGSTLLARALDDPGASLVLREPLALRQTALAPDPARLALVLAMLGRRYRADAPTLVKANVPVNFLLPELAEAEPAARAILLYLPLRDYLAAILRSATHRAWLRNVTGQLAAHLGDLSASSDATRAAALWLAQIRAFAAALERMPNARALDAERFFAGPAAVLKAAAAHLAVPVAPDSLDAIAAGPLFATYSKDPRLAFDNAARLERRAEVCDAIAAELDEAEIWVAGKAPEAKLAERAL